MAAELDKAARRAVALAKPKRSETFLVVTDTLTLHVGMALFEAASEKCEANLIVMHSTGQHGTEPPKLVSDAMVKADIVYCPTKYSLTHTNATRAALKKARIATLPEMTEGILVRGMKVDYERIRKTNAKLARLMKGAKEIRVKAWKTDFTVKRGARRIWTGDARIKRGHVVNLPSGETGFAPVGFDGYFTGTHGRVHKSRTFTVKNNRVVGISDRKLKKAVWSIRNARNIAEFAMGTNPGAKTSGHVIEDEKVLGTCHVAIGDSKSMGGVVDAPIHWDFIIKKPTIWFGKKKVMEKGRLLT